MTLKEQIMKLQTYKMFEVEDTIYVERDDVLKILEQQEHCEDCISREAVKKLICQSNDKYGYSDRFHEFTEECLQLPSVQPQQKTGHWILVTNGRGGHECNICHEYAPSYQSGNEYLSKYCPNCGCRMFEPQESEAQE